VVIGFPFRIEGTKSVEAGAVSSTAVAFKEHRGKHDVPVCMSFGLADVDHHTGTIDVLKGKPARFRYAKPDSINGHQESPILKRDHGIQQSFDLLQAQDSGKMRGLFG
jgi:hypothetical protein